MKNIKLRSVIATGIVIGLFIASPHALAIENQPKEIATIEKSKIEISIPQVIKKETILVKQQETKIEEIYEEVSDYVYTTDRVNIRTRTDIESEILVTAEVGTKLQRVGKNVIPGWDWIKINDCDYYISNKYITIEEPEQLAKSIEQQLEDNKISNLDLRYMSAIIYAEAGNQCQAGQQAVGIVVMERVESNEFKSTIYDVLHEPGQFSPVANGSLAKALDLYDNGKLPNEVIEAAKYALQGNTTVYYNDTTYDLDGYLYFSRYVSGCRLQIQDHMFK